MTQRSHYPSRTLWTIVFSIAAIGFLLRVGYRLYNGPSSFWDNGYTFFVELARNLSTGRGFRLGDLAPTAFRVPGYPIFLAAVTLGRPSFLPIVFSQAVIGAGTVVAAALLAKQLFSPKAAVLAAGLTAFYPYYVIHDTALQETSLFTFLTLLSILLLLQALRSGSRLTSVLAGMALAADVLTRATIAPFAVLAIAWLFGKQRRCAAICAGMLTLSLAPWLVRSYRLTGSPTLTTETGLQLWDGNNSYTFSHYPCETIDLSKEAAWKAMPLEEKAELDSVRNDEAKADAWYLRKGLDYIRHDPWLAAKNGVRKIEAAFGLWPSPRKDSWANWIHLLSYGPMMVLGLAGMFAYRKAYYEHVIFYALFASFAVVTAVFFSHTSHRTYLDVYFIVFAAALATGEFAEQEVDGAARR